MACGWTISSDDLLVPGAGPGGAAGKAQRLRVALREAITNGTLAAGTRLPPTRVLAEDLGVARGVVVAAYEQLVAEGFLVGRQGSGTVVADIPLTPDPVPQPAASPGWTHDLRPGFCDLGAFPRRAWAAAVRAVVGEATDDTFGYRDPTGPPAARQALAAYLGRARGVRTDPQRVILTSGFTSALGTVVAALVEAGVDTIAVEDPGGYEQRSSIAAAGARVVPVPVDDRGLVVDALAATPAGAVLVTPAHQYPLGVALDAERRAALAAWARDRRAVIVEDDYDAEFRYDREPVGTVQGIAPDATIYLGSVAKALAPALRIGWIVVPPQLAEAVRRQRALRDSQPSSLDHLAFARLLHDGTYDRHLRQQRRRYRERRDVLVEQLAVAGVGHGVTGVAAGLHAVLALEAGTDDVAVVEALQARSVAVNPLSWYTVESGRVGLLVGFGNVPPSQLATAVPLIAEEVLRTSRDRGQPPAAGSAAVPSRDGPARTGGHPMPLPDSTT